MINKMGNNTSFYYLKALMPSICYDGVITLYVYVHGGKQPYKLIFKLNY